MVDITKYPYFSYGPVVETLMEPIRRYVDVDFLMFTRKFPDQTRFLVSSHHSQTIDYYAQGLYKHGLFERDSTSYESGFHMWDHLPCDPNGIYSSVKRDHQLAHGLTIVEQHGDYCDTFLFATTPDNDSVNNFYLNNKDLFTQFVRDFYEALGGEFDTLAQHKIFVPFNRESVPLVTLSPRQQECAILMIEGYTTKEIARALDLSPRTVQEYIDIIKDKFEARNRLHLQGLLKKRL